MSSDKPTIHASLASLDVEAAPEPFRFGLSGGKTITFPDPGSFDWLEAEEFMQHVQNAPNSEVLRRWLSEDDYAKLKAEKLTLRQINGITKAVGEHYRSIFGGPGEDTASTAS